MSDLVGNPEDLGSYNKNQSINTITEYKVAVTSKSVPY